MSASNIDALPYYDKQVDEPGAKTSAQALIQSELRLTPQLVNNDPRLPREVDVFPASSALSDLLANYSEAPIRGIDIAKYAPPTILENATLGDLKSAEERGRIGEGHMALRNENAAVLASYAPNAWLVRNYQLQSQSTELQTTLTGVKEQITEVNRSRRVFQEDTGQHLSRLEGRWQDLVGAIVQLEMACGVMEGEVRNLRRKEEELKKEVADLEAAQ